MAELISEGFVKTNAEIMDASGEYGVYAAWTVQDGRWEPGSGDFAPPQWAVDTWLQTVDAAGAATHILMRRENAAGEPIDTSFFVKNRYEPSQPAKVLTPGNDGWANFPMAHSSGYNPDKGEQGPWSVALEANNYVYGVGLPYSWHVSTYLVWRPKSSLPPGPSPIQVINLRITRPTIINIVLEKDVPSVALNISH